MSRICKNVWKLLRHVSGDDAYERYLLHFSTHHKTEDGLPLSKKAYFKVRLESKWSGINRCC